MFRLEHLACFNCFHLRASCALIAEGGSFQSLKAEVWSACSVCGQFPAALLQLPTLLFHGTHRPGSPCWYTQDLGGPASEEYAIHPLSLSETLTGARTLCRLAQWMGGLLPSYLPSTRVLVSASALKVVLFNICGKKRKQSAAC